MNIVELFLQAVQTGTISNISMPNAQMRVIDMGVWWNVLAERNGWKLEQHKITKHCRIISPDKIRVAWGGEEAIRKLFTLGE